METDGVYPLNAILDDVPRVESGRCTGCGRCVAACPQQLFTLDPIGFRKISRLRVVERCGHCGRCIESCPVAAISK